MESIDFTLRHSIRRLETQLEVAVKEQARTLDATSRFATELAEDPTYGRFAVEGNLTSAAADAARWTTECRTLQNALDLLRS